MSEAGPRPLTRREWVFLGAAVAVALAVNFALLMRGFGEGDAARLAVQALAWHDTGELEILTYTVRVSPLYLTGLRRLLEAGVAPEQLPAWMNAASAVAGALVWVPLYLLWRRAANPPVALAACLLFAFTPAFWHANHYGMPHLPAFLFFALACVCAGRFLAATGAAFLGWLTLACLCACLALGLKADVIMAFGAPVGLAFLVRRAGPRNLVACALVPLVGLFFVTRYASTIAPALGELGDLGGHAGRWSERFPITLEALLNPDNVVVPAYGAGVALFALMVAAVAFALVSREHRRLAVWALFWSTPALLFWGLREGNSTRHMMAVYPPLCLLVAVAGSALLPSRGLRVGALVALLVGNYFAAPAFSRTFRMGGRLFSGQARVQADVDRVVERAREFRDLRAPTKVLGGSWTLPYVVWDLLLASDDYRIAWGRTSDEDQWSDMQLETHIDGRRELVQLSISRRKLFTPLGAVAWTAQDEVEVIDHPRPSARRNRTPEGGD